MEFRIEKDRLEVAKHEAYNSAGHNASFGGAFESGVQFALNELAKKIAENEPKKDFKVNDKLKITNRIHGHEFTIGETVTVRGFAPSPIQEARYLCANDKLTCWISEHEAMLIE